MKRLSSFLLPLLLLLLCACAAQPDYALGESASALKDAAAVITSAPAQEQDTEDHYLLETESGTVAAEMEEGLITEYPSYLMNLIHKGWSLNDTEAISFDHVRYLGHYDGEIFLVYRVEFYYAD